MTHKPDRNRKRISTAASIKGLTAVLKCMLASIFLTCLLPASSLQSLELRGKQKDEAFHAPTGVPQMV